MTPTETPENGDEIVEETETVERHETVEETERVEPDDHESGESGDG